MAGLVRTESWSRPVGRRLRTDVEAARGHPQRLPLLHSCSAKLPSTVKRPSAILVTLHVVSCIAKSSHLKFTPLDHMHKQLKSLS